MALRKEYFDEYEEHYKDNKAMKRVRITFDVDPELQQRIKVAAAKRNLSLSEYLGNILERVIPPVESENYTKGHPVTSEAIEQLRQVREGMAEYRHGKPLEDANETIWQMREERSRELEQL